MPEDERVPLPGDGDSFSSNIDDWSYHSCHETATCPTERMLLEEMLVMRPYQIDPNDRACAGRIEQLQQSISAYEGAERALPWIPQHRGSLRSTGRRRMGDRTGDVPSEHGDSNVRMG